MQNLLPSQGVNIAQPNKMDKITALFSSAARRGGNVLSLPKEAGRMRQPQDGALPVRAKISNIALRLSGDLLQEAEDERLTGGTRSLASRLLGLNFGVGMGSKRRKTASLSALVAGPVKQSRVA